ncbi:MAG: NADH-quinone oxidoreductase subunit L [Zoogloeaceae bacterium]|jgi:NADH-quinone oxidoreductase subunit L|nr:NADH-quinone oxidoreductase subunit L [Zoogloeaceae bacterium]
MELKTLALLIALSPLFGALVAGVFCRSLPRGVAAGAAIFGVSIAFFGSVLVLLDVLAGNTFNGEAYQWLSSAEYRFSIGFLIDPLTSLMMLVVTFVSLMVHIYTLGYMRDDPGFNRFFAYISLFTFAMLMLVMSNNFLQLFFAWEAVGLVSYLLIGFWYTRPTAIAANLKAFLVNRVGDLGFLLGIALVLAHCGSLDYAAVFARAPGLSGVLFTPWAGASWSLPTVICVCLFIGAMGKSAQIPLHVWLPDSMEGPTPISALIHAATMVTAGIFMVSRLSPLFELSETALSLILVIGALTALLMGLLGIVQHDIKRVVAYSTLSQLGYMTMALGVSAYPVAIFHLTTHAFFKALLFLAAGSVIIALRHDQDMRRMGGLRKYMPLTWIVCLIGLLALTGAPFFSGFYSKDAIIEAIALSSIPGAGFAYTAALAGVFVTALYSFRLYFLVFHGQERFAAAHKRAPDSGHGEAHGLSFGEKPREPSRAVTVPLVFLAIPSLILGALFVEPLLAGDFFAQTFADTAHGEVMRGWRLHFPGALAMGLHALATPVFWLALLGAGTAWFCVLFRPEVPAMLGRRFSVVRAVLENHYYFDRLYQKAFADGARALGRGFWRAGDTGLLDGALIHGAVRFAARCAAWGRALQSGYLYHYAFAMIAALAFFLAFWVVPAWGASGFPR